MLKYSLFLWLLFVNVITTFAQEPSPVKWAFTVKQNGKETELLFTATIKSGYHVYSQDISPDAGPIPTTFTFNPAKEFELDGKVTEGKSTEIFDTNFGVKLKYFSEEAVFHQKIKTSNTTPFAVTGTVTFMVCDDKRCYPPEDVPFRFEMNEISSRSK